jgi:hypothetical protein
MFNIPHFGRDVKLFWTAVHWRAVEFKQPNAFFHQPARFTLVPTKKTVTEVTVWSKWQMVS